jgi:hypothetical protein
MRIFGNHAILEGSAPAIVIEMSDSIGMTKEAEKDSSTVVTPAGSKAEIEFYNWGSDNNMPNKLIESAYKNNVLASNLDFNARIGYGDTIQVVRRSRNVSNEIEYVPLMESEAQEVFDFLRDNNYALLQQELIHDLMLLNNSFVEFIMNKACTKILQVRHKEAAYSRLSMMNDDGRIEYHGYCSDWTNSASEKVIATPLLDYDNPLYDLKVKMGKKPDENGKSNNKKIPRHILHIAPPSPGKFYYQKAYWWSIFESHWFDFSCSIPEFKMNLMQNQMVLKYHVQIRKGFFDDMFRSEGITDPKKKEERKLDFYRQLEDFLSGKENAGKNFVSEISYNDIQKGLEIQDIKITPIESFIKGGEYIEDSEEASNAICYAMGVHPSLQGASPGKNKTINGTEARELFIIKQAMMKPIRDLLLQPLQIVKDINGWDPDIDFIIPNIMLTTLDQGTGSVKQIGNQIN